MGVHAVWQRADHCIDGDGKSFVTDIKENDLWYFPTGIPHSIQGLGPDGCEFLLVFDDGYFSEFETVLLSDWMAHTPPEVLAKNFGVDQKALRQHAEEGIVHFPGGCAGPLEEDPPRGRRKTWPFAHRFCLSPYADATHGEKQKRRSSHH